MWLILALLASVLWGMTYVLNEKMFEYISVPTSLAIGLFFGCIAMMTLSISQGNFLPDMHTLINSRRAMWLTSAGTVTFILADWLIAVSIHEKNAALASLIEITYPVFIIIFAFLFFRELQINLTIALGGILAFAGVALVYWGSR